MDSFNPKDLFAPITRRILYSGVRHSAKRNLDLQAEEQDGGALTRAQAKQQKLDSPSNLPSLPQTLVAATAPLGFEPPDAQSENEPVAPTNSAHLEFEARNTEPESEPVASTSSRLAEPSTSTDLLPMGESDHITVKPSTAPLISSNSEYENDSVVVKNDTVEAHIYQSYHRHQKIFT